MGNKVEDDGGGATGNKVDNDGNDDDYGDGRQGRWLQCNGLRAMAQRDTMKTTIATGDNDNGFDGKGRMGFDDNNYGSKRQQ